MFCCSQNKKTHHKEDKFGQPNLYVLSQRYRFSTNDLLLYLNRFQRMSKGSTINLALFREHMGLFGLRSNSVLADRIFRLMDKSNKGLVNFTDFLDYMDVLINGTREEKLLQSFRLIAQKDKRFISYDDFSSWIRGIRKVFNSMSENKIESSEDDVREYFDMIDTKRDGVIDFKEYKQSFGSDCPLFDWIDVVKKSDNSLSRSEIKKPWRSRLDSVEHEINTCLEILESPSQDKELLISYQDLSMPRLNLSSISTVSPERGPQFNSIQELKHSGDNDDPSFFSDSDSEIPFMLEDSNRSTKHTKTTDTLFSESSDYQAKQKAIADSLRVLAKKISDIKESSNENASRMISSPSKIKCIQWGDDDWNLILNMMLGIQKAVKAVEDLSYDFTVPLAKECASKSVFTLSHETSEFESCKFSDYAPGIFKRIRTRDKIDDEEYTDSLGLEKIMRNLINSELSSMIGLMTCGRSGSLFYFSDDGKFILKTIPYDEYALFRNILADYYSHLLKNPDSLLPRFYGFHKIYLIKDGNHIKRYFLVMKNTFPRKYQINLKFDLKGSTFSRSTNPSEDPNIARKDNDFNNSGLRIKLGPEKRQRFLEIIQNDVKFFLNMNIMDYSLLVGFHRLRENIEPEAESMSFAQRNGGGLISNDGEELYFIGLIDILTLYTPKKKFENLVKGSIFGQSAVSSVHPKIYASRFQKYVASIID
ncbi:unnamed protein product [Blepharisma stoltei]|uniref:Phosphatidylinositol-4-phosphate 5-kinase n=1 Tax=Blepharisma stoltei TaxID=1481888 RepID=A0AAU9KAE0_9CILI|nr:unnamed protein product [Blepharisma stoltei]